MAVMVIFRSPQVNQAQYDAIIEALDLERNPPAGSLLHLCGFSPAGLCVTDAWDSREAWDAFARDRLAAAFRKVGVDPGAPEIIDVYAMTLNAPVQEIAPTPA